MFLQQLFCLTGSYSNQVFLEPLSREEEEKYLREMANGSNEARCKLIEHNLRLVAHIVKRFETTNYDADDLIGIGTIGLIKGVDSYKQEKDIKLTTYIAKCIQNEIFMFFRKVKGEVYKTISLQDSVGYDKDGNEINLAELIHDNTLAMDISIETKDNLELVNKFINKLLPREKEILKKRYGLMNTKEQTQKEIAKEMNISRSYVSRIEKRALSKILKEFIKNKKK